MNGNEAENVNEVSLSDSDESPLRNTLTDIIATRQKDNRALMMMHLNINSIQNKFEDFNMLVDQLKAHVIFLTETKIDASYPNSQFKIRGYNMYRNDRKKGEVASWLTFHLTYKANDSS